MSVKLIESNGTSIKLEIEFTFSNSMLGSESVIQDKLNEVGVVATTEALKKFDTDGSPIVIGNQKLTTKGKVLKEYQTPYGVATVERHVYQSSKGGKTFCPLEQNARIVITSTPRFAKQISHKFAESASPQVQQDFSENHNRHVARSYLQNVANAIGTVVEAKEESWHYELPKIDEPIKTISIGLDGTCMLLCHDGYRETMVGTVALFDAQGKRHHTTYVAASPEYGKATFKARLTHLINEVKKQFPEAKCIGVADGAKENWNFLEQHTNEQTIDFWHASQYLSIASEALYPRSKADRKKWLEDKCHQLKHGDCAAKNILTEVSTHIEDKQISKLSIEKYQKFKTYFTNNMQRMDYAKKAANNEPIGSGVTEAACKVIVKQRLCKSGSKWKDKGARVVLSLRALRYSNGYWQQFWNKVDRYGFPIAA